MELLEAVLLMAILIWNLIGDYQRQHIKECLKKYTLDQWIRWGKCALPTGPKYSRQTNGMSVSVFGPAPRCLACLK